MSESMSIQRGLARITPDEPANPVEGEQAASGADGLLKLASNENPLGPSPRAVAAIAAALSQVNYYPDDGAYKLRRALASHLDVRPEQVHVSNGADGLIRELCEAFVDENDQVIVSEVSFPNYDTAAHIMRGEVVKTPLRAFGLDLDAMLAAITERTKLLFVCNPNNPTGTIVTAGEVERFMARVPDRVLVVFDEAYKEFVTAADYPQTLDYVRSGRENTIVVRTFSKIYGVAGLRLGYGVANQRVQAALRAAADSFPVNYLAQVAGEAALGDVAFVEQTLAAVKEGRQYLYRSFERMGLACVPSHTNFILVRLGPRASAVIEALRAQGVIIRPGNGYNLPEYAPRYHRHPNSKRTVHPGAPAGAGAVEPPGVALQPGRGASLDPGKCRGRVSWAASCCAPPC